MKVILVCETPGWGIEEGTTVKAELSGDHKRFNIISVEKGSIKPDLLALWKEREGVPVNGVVWRWKVVGRFI